MKEHNDTGLSRNAIKNSYLHILCNTRAKTHTQTKNTRSSLFFGGMLAQFEYVVIKTYFLCSIQKKNFVQSKFPPFCK